MNNQQKRGFFVANCVEFMRGMGENCVDLTITSPPYDNLRNYTGYSFEFEAVAEQLYRVTKDGGVLVWVVGDRINGGRSLTSFAQALFFQQVGFRMHDVMIYRKKIRPLCGAMLTRIALSLCLFSQRVSPRHLTR